MRMVLLSLVALRLLSQGENDAQFLREFRDGTTTEEVMTGYVEQIRVHLQSEGIELGKRSRG